MIGAARRAARLLLAGVAAGALWSCASDSDGARLVGPTVGTPRSASVTADWDDVDAAVQYAVGRAEMAVVFDETPSATERVYYLRTIRDEPAKLTVRRAGSGSPAAMELEARAGVFGRPYDEQRLLDAVRRRLEDLKGVEYAPVRTP